MTQFADPALDESSALLVRQIEALEHELLTARAIERFMLPPETQTAGRYDVSLMYQPLHHIGGDFFDLLHRPDGAVVLLLADISGHGVPAAMTFAMLKLAFGRAARLARDPREVLSEMQSEMADKLPARTFVTALAAFLAPDGRSVRIASAGHPNPLLLRDGRVSELTLTPGFPLLVAPDDPPARESIFMLEGHDRLILLTDGAQEARAAAGESCNSAGALIAAIEKHTRLAGPRFLQAVYETMFYGAHVFHDDVTLVAVEVAP